MSSPLTTLFQATWGVVDDRNFRGPPAEVVEALRACDKFDQAVGLLNHPDKFAAVAIDKGTSKWLCEQDNHGKRLHVLKRSVHSTMHGCRAP